MRESLETKKCSQQSFNVADHVFFTNCLLVVYKLILKMQMHMYIFLHAIKIYLTQMTSMAFCWRSTSEFILWTVCLRLGNCRTWFCYLYKLHLSVQILIFFIYIPFILKLMMLYKSMLRGTSRVGRIGLLGRCSKPKDSCFISLKTL